MMELPEPGAGIVLGLKLTVVPLGPPVADKLTALLNPSETVVKMVPVTFPPVVPMFTALGAVNVKDGGSAVVTVSTTDMFWTMPPPLAVTVKG